MDDAFFNIPMGMKRVICVAPITREMLSSSGIDCLGDDCGYFVYETVEGDPIRAFNILAKGLTAFIHCAAISVLYTLSLFMFTPHPRS